MLRHRYCFPICCGFLLSLMVIGCGGKKSIVGTWTGSESGEGKEKGPVGITFNADGTCRSGAAKGTYEMLDGSKFKIVLRMGNADTGADGWFDAEMDEVHILGKRLKRTK